MKISKDKIPSYVGELLSVLNFNGVEAYVVGGAVRDLLLGKEPKDFDIAASSEPELTTSIFEEKGYTVIKTGIRHGTVSVMASGKLTEITSFRSDGAYSDSRRPDSVSFSKNINDDVARRDFTINAMYLSQDGEVRDFFGGMDDLNAGIIRTVGEPSLRFSEDALRIMRAMRFSATLGFTIESATQKAMIDNAYLLTRISGERKAIEFEGLITAPFASNVIRNNIDILSVIVPEIKQCQGFEQHSVYHNLDVLEHTLSVIDNVPLIDNRRDYVTATAAFFHDIGKPEVYVSDPDGTGHMKMHAEAGAAIFERVARELKFSKSDTRDINELILYHDTFVQPNRASVHKFMTEHSPEILDKLEILQRADIMAHSERGMHRLEKLEAWTSIRSLLISENAVISHDALAINGSDLIAAGFLPGKQMGELLDNAFDMVINERIPNEREPLLAYILSLRS